MIEYSQEDFGNRVRIIRKELKLSQKSLAESLNLSGSFLSDVESGKAKACYDFIFNFSLTFNVNLYYLVFGKGNMFGSNGTIFTLGDKKFGDPVVESDQLIWLISKSSLVKHTVMSAATIFIMENEEIVKLEIMRNENRKNE